MTGHEYQELALRTINPEQGTPEKLLQNGVMGLCGEAGECCDMVKKYLFQGHPLDLDVLKKELGDVAWYLAITAHAIGIDLDAVFDGNISKLRARYPEGFTTEASVHRAPGDV